MKSHWKEVVTVTFCYAPAFDLVCAVNTHGPLLISEDIDNSLSDYMKALAMLEQLVEPDHRRTVELYPL